MNAHAAPTSLSAGTALAAAIVRETGLDCFPGTLDASTEALLPYCYYSLDSLSAVSTKAGMADSVNVSVHCCAEAYDEALQMAEDVRQALDNARPEGGGVRCRRCTMQEAAYVGYVGNAHVFRLTFQASV